MVGKRRRSSSEDRRIGARLRQIRVSRKLSQSEVGEALGVSFQQIQKYENGSNAIASSRMGKLCEVLKITPGQLLDHADQPAEVLTASSYALRTAQRIDQLSGAEKEVVNNLLRAFEGHRQGT